METLPVDKPLVLLTGATGYVGGRLLTALVEKNAFRIRCMVRKPGYLQARVSREVEVVPGDLGDPVSVARALQDVDCAYYLVHSMGEKKDFEESDREAALSFSRAALVEGVK